MANVNKVVEILVDNGFNAEAMERTKDGVLRTCVVIKEEGRNISPVFYVDNMRGDEYDIADNIMGKYDEAKVDNVNVEDIMNVNNAILCVRPITNDDALTIPYLNLELYVRIKALNIGTIKVTENHLQILGVTKEELFDIAKRNTAANTRFVTMYDKMCQMLGGQLPDEFDVLKDEKQYVVLNDDGLYGAGVIGIPDLFCNFTKGCYIIPSSIHEVIIYENDGEYTVNDMRDIIKEVNNTELQPDEILSYDLYFYDSNTNTIKVLN